MNKIALDLWVQISSDKKKATALATMSVLALGLWVRAALVSGPTPSSADAAVADSSGASASGGVVSTNGQLTPGQDRESPEHDTIVLPARTPLSRDLFALSGRYFPPQSPGHPTPEERPKSSGGNDDNHVEQDRLNRRLLIEKVTKEAGALRLRSTIVGAQPLAVIELTSTTQRRHRGVVVRLGQVIEGFKLIEVRGDGVALEKSGVRIELDLPKP